MKHKLFRVYAYDFQGLNPKKIYEGDSFDSAEKKYESKRKAAMLQWNSKKRKYITLEATNGDDE